MRNLVLLLLFCNTAIAQTVGVVVKSDGDCPAGSDRMVIKTRSGFVLAEWYGGSFFEGRRVYGNLHSYGFKDVRVESSDGRVYIEDYMASNSKAVEWCFDHDED